MSEKCTVGDNAGVMPDQGAEQSRIFVAGSLRKKNSRISIGDVSARSGDKKREDLAEENK